MLNHRRVVLLAHGQPVKIRTHTSPRSLLYCTCTVHSYHAAKPTLVPPNRLALVYAVVHVCKSAAADHIQPNVGPASGLPRMRSGSKACFHYQQFLNATMREHAMPTRCYYTLYSPTRSCSRSCLDCDTQRLSHTPDMSDVPHTRVLSHQISLTKLHCIDLRS